MKDHADLLALGGSIMTMDRSRRLLEEGGLAIRGGRIVAIDTATEIKDSYSAPEVLDLSGQVVLPGLINAHTHVLQILLRGGLGGNRALYDWLVNVLTPGLAQFTPADASVATSLYCLEAIRSGITTVVENADVGLDEQLARATLSGLRQSGLRAIYARLFYDKSSDDLDPLITSLSHGEGSLAPLESGEEALASIEDLMRQFNDDVDGNIRVWPAPAMPQTTSEEALIGAFELAERHNMMVGIHVAQAKIDRFIEGLPVFQYLDGLGVLGPRLQAAHCVWLSDSDIELLSERGSKVVHNPVSNLYLCAGIAPVASMLSQGVTVGLGTDDANSNNVVNLFQEIKFAVLVHRGKTLEPKGLTPVDALEMATIGGARSIGLEQEIGSLETGKRADFIAVRLSSPHMIPRHDLFATLAFQAGGTEVSTSVVGGRVLMRDRHICIVTPEGQEEVIREAQARSIEIARRAGLTIEAAVPQGAGGESLD